MSSSMEEVVEEEEEVIMSGSGCGAQLQPASLRSGDRCLPAYNIVRVW